MLKKVLERDNAVQGKDKIINTLLEQNKDIAIINEQLKVKDLQIANMQKHIDKLTDKLCN